MQVISIHDNFSLFQKTETAFDNRIGNVYTHRYFGDNVSFNVITALSEQHFWYTTVFSFYKHSAGGFMHLQWLVSKDAVPVLTVLESASLNGFQ